jgi:Transposase.
VLVFEATGVYSRRLEAYLVQNGLRYYLLNPLVARKRLDNGCRLRKNDQFDAKALARSEIMPGVLEFTQTKVPVYTELADMSRFYEQLNEGKKRARNRIYRLLQLTFATFTDKFDLTTPSALEISKHYRHSELLRDKDLTELEKELRSWQLTGVGEFRLKNYAKRLFRAASRNQTAVIADSHNTYQLRYQINQLQQLVQAQKELIQRMSEVAGKLPE